MTMSDPALERIPMTNDTERVSDIVARLRDMRDRAQHTINTGGRDDFDPRDVPFVADDAIDIIEAQSKALAEARAEAFAECARIADKWQKHPDTFGAHWIADDIRKTALTPTPENPNG